MDSEKRFCKKCKCELSSYSKGKLCGNCRKKRNDRLKKGFFIVLGILVLPIGIAYIIFVNKNKK